MPFCYLLSLRTSSREKLGKQGLRKKDQISLIYNKESIRVISWSVSVKVKSVLLLITSYRTPLIKCRGHDNKGNDHQFKKLLIIKQILLVSTIGNVKRTV